MFLLLRRSLDWAKSYYKQAVINPAIHLVDFYATPLTFDDFVQHPRVQQLMNHATLTADVARGYGAARVVTGDAESDWLKQLLSFTGVEIDEAALPTRVNVSPPPWAIEIMRQVNAFKLSEPERLAWKAALQDFTNSGHAVLAAAKQHATDWRPSRAVLRSLVPRSDPDFELSTEQLAAFPRIFSKPPKCAPEAADVHR